MRGRPCLAVLLLLAGGLAPLPGRPELRAALGSHSGSSRGPAGTPAGWSLPPPTRGRGGTGGARAASPAEAWAELREELQGSAQGAKGSEADSESGCEAASVEAASLRRGSLDHPTDDISSSSRGGGGSPGGRLEDDSVRCRLSGICNATLERQRCASRAGGGSPWQAAGATQAPDVAAGEAGAAYPWTSSGRASFTARARDDGLACLFQDAERAEHVRNAVQRSWQAYK